MPLSPQATRVLKLAEVVYGKGACVLHLVERTAVLSRAGTTLYTTTTFDHTETALDAIERHLSRRAERLA